MQVPVSAPKELAWIDKDARDESMRSLIAGPQPTAESGQSFVDVDGPQLRDNSTEGNAEDELRNHVKKRRLYRQSSANDHVWFPFEMAIPLAQELVWESGGDDVSACIVVGGQHA